MEWTIGISITALATSMHVLLLTHGGALWRDEAGVVQLANLSSFQELLQWFPHDSFPPFFLLLVRGWSGLGMGGTDFELRLFGFVMGCLLLAAVWFSSRLLVQRPPILALGLLAANVTVLRWGDSLRAYGCGAALILLAYGFIWRQMTKPCLGRWILASLAALIAVQCLYSNAFLVFAVCASGVVVCLAHKQHRTAVSIFGVGVPATLSLLPYIKPLIGVQEYYALQKIEVTAGVIWAELQAALGDPKLLMPWLWIGLGTFLLARGTSGFKSPNIARPLEAKDLRSFAALSLLTASLSFLLYLKLSGLVKLWYFIPFLGIVSVCFEAAFENAGPRTKAIRMIVSVALFAAVFPGSLTSARAAYTSMDANAHYVQRQAQADDLILVFPWYYGISFARYYGGGTAWSTVPPIDDLRFHRYDLVKQRIMAEAPLGPVLDRIKQILASNHRVWLLGPLTNQDLEGPPPPSVPPGPIPGMPNGWWEGYHMQIWGAQLAHFIRNHAMRIDRVPTPDTGPVLGIEAASLYVVSGWRE